MTTFDALVVGAGPAGSAAAIRLALAGARVAIVEREPFPRRKVCGEFLSGPSWELLDALGVRHALEPRAGPPVRSLGFFCGETVVVASAPGRHEGRAVGRDQLDAVLLERAAALGAHVVQPAVVEGLVREAGLWHARIRERGGDHRELRAHRVVDAHGSWLQGPLHPLPARSPRELLGFKALFVDAALPGGLMPLLVFPGGYGGLVETSDGRVSFSCCIRHDVLKEIRRGHDSVGAALMAHVSRSNRGFREALGAARLDGEWRGAGPIKPGVRTLAGNGVFAAGNAAGEAHPMIAEGISMAMQGGWLAAHHVQQSLGAAKPEHCERAYARAWRANFLLRLRAAGLFAGIGGHAAPAMAAALRVAPRTLTLGALFSGKAHSVPEMHAP